jgi:hypothetical protein
VLDSALLAARSPILSGAVSRLSTRRGIAAASSHFLILLATVLLPVDASAALPGLPCTASLSGLTGVARLSAGIPVFGPQFRRPGGIRNG